MNRILVPTDFSPNSEAGVRFAIQWADRQKTELVFIHVLNVARLTRWSDAQYAEYAAEQESLCKDEFKQFITGLYSQLGIQPGVHAFEIVQGGSPDLCIVDYCLKHPDIDCICISTRGADKAKKLFGTNTGNLITKSPVPVMAVPQNHEGFGVSTIMYATDLKSFDQELEIVNGFAQPFNASIDVVHIENNPKTNIFIKSLENEIQTKNPDIVVMFTNQKRTLLQKFFQGSRAEELSFRVTKPLLVFNKN
jgi:Universal stress protein UspA and related nucleotide-binding proteins